MRSHTSLPWPARTERIHTDRDKTLKIVDVTAQAAACNAFDDHVVVLRGTSKASGLDALIALHDTTLGPALGGCRVWNYAGADEALQDVLRLSKGMSYKAAMAGLPLGGGKAVINCAPHTGKTDDLLHSFGMMVDLFDGAYITAEDVGTTVADMNIVSEVTPHVQGRADDPSPSTARGVMIGMQAALLHRFGVSSLSGVTIAIQGLGKVGMSLCAQTYEAGANLIVADLDDQMVIHAVDAFHAQAISPDAIFQAKADIFAPCAMGGILNTQTIPMMKFQIIAGSANNQLLSSADGLLLNGSGILYAPDYVINSGGLIDAYLQMPSALIIPTLTHRLTKIGESLNGIFQLSKQEHAPTNIIADRLAREKIKNASQAHTVLE